VFIWVWLEVFRCVRLHAAPNRPTGESSRLQSGEELKAEIRSRTLSAPARDAHVVFTYSITDEVNNMQYLSNSRTFQKCFYEQHKHFLYTAYMDICSRIKFNINIYYLNTNKVGVYLLLSVFFY